MSTASLFQNFIKNISIKNSSEISKEYNKVTKTLNSYYYDSLDNDTSNCRQIGSYGRHTGINGISDLDMAFELPTEIYKKFNKYAYGQQSALLQDVRKALLETYDAEQIQADGQVVGIFLEGFQIEVLPTFYLTNKKNSQEIDTDVYTFPDSNNGGRWRTTLPKKEMSATRDLNNEIGNNIYRYLCRMVRAWKNNVGAGCSGLWIDTLCYNFLNKYKAEYTGKSFKHYDVLVKDFFGYLVDCYDNSPDQKIWRAPGSLQNVHGSWSGHRKIKKAYRLCLEAIETPELANENWSIIFGINFPDENDVLSERQESSVTSSLIVKKSAITEKFIEIEYKNRIDIRNQVEIDYKISNETYTWKILKKALPHFTVPIQRDLEFFIKKINVKAPYTVKWKVKNVGYKAKQTNQERGQLISSTYGKHETSILKERSNFEGAHWVECYIIKDGVCVARDKVKVTI